MFDMCIAIKKKQLQDTNIYYSKKQTNIKYYNAKLLFVLSFFPKTYIYVINKSEHTKFITELDSEKPFHDHQVKIAHSYIVE